MKKEKQLLSYFVATELYSKLLITSNVKLPGIELTNYFQTNEIKMIKNLISSEIFLFKRPKIMATVKKKKVQVRFITTVELDHIWFLQKNPILGGFIHKTKYNIKDFFFNPVFLIKNNQLVLQGSLKNTAEIILIKSALLD